jgi:hypothetical protein
MNTILFRVLGWLGVAAIGVLSLVPGELRAHASPGIPGPIEHVLAYLVTAALLGLGYRGQSVQLRTFGLMMLYAGALEIAQLWVPGRDSRLTDFLASSTGAFAGLLIAKWLVRLGRSNEAHSSLPTDPCIPDTEPTVPAWLLSTATSKSGSSKKP